MRDRGIEDKAVAILREVKKKRQTFIAEKNTS